MEFVSDLFSNFWVSLAGKLLLVALILAATVTAGAEPR